MKMLETCLRSKGCRILTFWLFLVIYPVGVHPLPADRSLTGMKVDHSGQQIGLAERGLELRLKNGMKVVMAERHQAPIVALNITYRVGSVHEKTGMTGMAHLFEQFALRGTLALVSIEEEKERPIL